MGDEHATGITHAQRIGLHLSRVTKLRGRQRYRRPTLNLKPYRVMQTARGTGTSVGQRFHDKVIVAKDLCSEIVRCGFGKRGFCVALDFNAR